MRRLCECGAVDDGRFCSKCGRSLEERPVLGPLDEIALGFKAAVGALAQYPRTLLESCRRASSVYASDSESFLGPVAFLSTSLLIQGWVLHLIFSGDPLSTFELPPVWRNLMNVIDKLPLSLPAFAIIGLLVSSVVPWLLLRLARRRVPFQPVLRMYCYFQGGPATVALLLLLLSLPILDALHESSEWVQLIMLPATSWGLYLATLHLSAVTSTGRWTCLALLLTNGLVVSQATHRLLQAAAPSFRVVSSSMWPTLRERDTVLCNGLAPNFRPLRRNELVAYARPGEERQSPSIGRVVGLPTEIVAIHDKTVMINGVALDETTLVVHGDQTFFPLDNTDGLMSQRDNMLPYRVPEQEYLLLGDNRDNAYDGRFFGPVPLKNILGVAYFRIYPVARAGPLGRTAG
jgi:signal peptidase I